MSRTSRFWRIFGGLIGIFLGLGAPSGCLLFRMAFAGQASPAWFQQELAVHAFFYLYMSLATPFVFFLFGFFWGLYKIRQWNGKLSLNI